MNLETATREELVELAESYRLLVDQALAREIPHEGCDRAYHDWLETTAEVFADPPDHLTDPRRYHDDIVRSFLEPFRNGRSLGETAAFYGWKLLLEESP